jgi:cell division septation protein DedD
MARTGKNDSANEPAETGGKPKRYRIEVGFKGLVFYSLGLLLALTWMFVFGILVGRGIPLVSSEEISVRAHLLRFLGLGTQVAKQAEPEVAEEFDSPRDMLSALDYYLHLTGIKKEAGPPALRPVPTLPPPTARLPGETPPQTPKSPAAVPSPRPPEQGAGSAPQPAAANEPGPPEHLTEHFSLLVSSMKEAENAQRLLEQLRSKGYAPRIESVNLGGSGRWNRVLIGYFPNREEAMRFAAEFNRKERMEGLVVRESR